MESIGEELNEGLQAEDSRCVGILETLAFSNMSTTTVNYIIDKAFGGLNEDYINEVSDAFINKAAKSALEKRRAERFSSGSSPIGLKGVQREARIQHAEDVVKKTEAPKQSAMDRLKGAVSKVKSWAQNVGKDNNKPVGLSAFKSEKPSVEEIKKSNADIQAQAVNLGTESAKKATQNVSAPATPSSKKSTSKKQTTSTNKKTTKKTAGGVKGKSSVVAQAVKQAEEVKEPVAEPVVARRGRPKKQ